MNKAAIPLLAVAILACGLETEPDPNCAKHNTLTDVPRCIQCDRDSDCQAGMSCVNQACVSGQDAATGGSGGNGGDGGMTGGSGGDGGMTGGSGGMTGGSGGMTGGTGGMTGGTGGDGSVSTCERDEQCSASLPQCNGDGECAPCTGQSACAGRDGKSHCEVSSSSGHRGACVECTQHGHCMEGDAHLCVDNACVECEDDQDCPASKPECGADGTCGACTGEAACSERPATPHCATAAGLHRGQCVECTSHGQCSNPEPQCGAMHVCEPCMDNDACEGRGGTVCDTSSDAPFGGTCVECTPTQYSGCESGGVDYVCESLTRTCSTTAVEHSRDACGECVSDAQCQEGKLCVRQTFNDPTDAPDEGQIEIGYFCAWRLDAPNGPDGSCFSQRPYVAVREDASSLDGTTADVCLLAVTTCPAYADYRSKDCETAPSSGEGDDALCGHPDAPHDGYCVSPDNTNTNFRCTTPCGGTDDCEPNFGCPLATPRVCLVQSEM
jgi:hypothetical protein